MTTTVDGATSELAALRERRKALEDELAVLRRGASFRTRASVRMRIEDALALAERDLDGCCWRLAERTAGTGGPVNRGALLELVSLLVLVERTTEIRGLLYGAIDGPTPAGAADPFLPDETTTRRRAVRLELEELEAAIELGIAAAGVETARQKHAAASARIGGGKAGRKGV
jgi:hypothetical protein